jgi:hypothetical protein
VVHGRLARGFLCLAALHGRVRRWWPLMSRFAETQPVRGRRTARAVTDSLAARRRHSIGNGRQWQPGTAKACRAPSSESNPKETSRCDDWFSSESRVGRSLFDETTIGHGSRVCLRQVPHRGFSRPSRWLAVVTEGARPAVTSGFGRWHLGGAVWCEPSGSYRDLGPSIRVGATSSEVAYRGRVGSATRAPILGVRAGHRRLAGGRQVRPRSEGHRSSLACRR